MAEFEFVLQHLTDYLNEDLADCVRRLDHAGVITSVCLCNRADMQVKGHIGLDGANIDQAHTTLGEEYSYCSNIG